MLRFSNEESSSLSAPLLLNITEEYCRAERRVLLIGQETLGWHWNSDLQINYPRYPHAWKFGDIRSCTDFLANPDSIEALCWGYREFQFAAYQPGTSRSPFWQAFREVRKWPGAGVMWGNIVRMDYSPPISEGVSLAILKAPESLRDSVISQQANLVADELAILEPHICLFFSGPYYDGFIRSVWPACAFLACNEAPARQLAKVVDDALPAASFRTYHPKYLRQGDHWPYIETIRKLAYAI
jgi:hypothetical protein